MSIFKCLFNMHNWSGCKCSICGKIRDCEHTLSGCKCSICGKILKEHIWSGCKCSICGEIRNEKHNWYGYKCSICNKTRDHEHNWVDGECTMCGYNEKEYIIKFYSELLEQERFRSHQLRRQLDRELFRRG